MKILTLILLITTTRIGSCIPWPVHELWQQLPQVRPAQGLVPAPLAPTPLSPLSSLLCLTARPGRGFDFWDIPSCPSMVIHKHSSVLWRTKRWPLYS